MCASDEVDRTLTQDKKRTFVCASDEVDRTLTSSKDWTVRDCSILIPPKSLLLLQISYWGVIQLVCCALLQIRGKHQRV